MVDSVNLTEHPLVVGTTAHRGPIFAMDSRALGSGLFSSVWRGSGSELSEGQEDWVRERRGESGAPTDTNSSALGCFALCGFSGR